LTINECTSFGDYSGKQTVGDLFDLRLFEFCSFEIDDHKYYHEK